MSFSHLVSKWVRTDLHGDHIEWSKQHAKEWITDEETKKKIIIYTSWKNGRTWTEKKRPRPRFGTHAHYYYHRNLANWWRYVHARQTPETELSCEWLCTFFSLYFGEYAIAKLRMCHTYVQNSIWKECKRVSYTHSRPFSFEHQLYAFAPLCVSFPFVLICILIVWQITEWIQVAMCVTVCVQVSKIVVVCCICFFLLFSCFLLTIHK